MEKMQFLRFFTLCNYMFSGPKKEDEFLLELADKSLTEDEVAQAAREAVHG